jgi:DHA1 family tetracycline resistance protein-like MFS transporter
MTLMSGRVSASEQGQLQGANNSLRAISELIGPSIFTLTFAYFISAGRHYEAPGAPFFLASALLASSVALALKVAGRTPQSIKTAVSGGATEGAETGH